MLFPLFSPSKAALFSRRRFGHGLAAGGVVITSDNASTGAPELRGTGFSLKLAELPVTFTRKPSVATAINGSIPAPALR